MEPQVPLVVENLTFRYRSREEVAIKNINLRVETPQVVLIAGVSGCGKTTLARCINGLIPRSYKGELHGSVFLHGQNIKDCPWRIYPKWLGQCYRILKDKFGVVRIE